MYCIVLYLLPVLNPKSYDGARVLEASGRPINWECVGEHSYLIWPTPIRKPWLSSGGFLVLSFFFSFLLRACLVDRALGFVVFDHYGYYDSNRVLSQGRTRVENYCATIPSTTSLNYTFCSFFQDIWFYTKFL